MCLTPLVKRRRAVLGVCIAANLAAVARLNLVMLHVWTTNVYLDVATLVVLMLGGIGSAWAGVGYLRAFLAEIAKGRTAVSTEQDGDRRA